MHYKSSILRKRGYNKNTPNAMLYGSPMYGGIGLQDMYIQHGSSKLQALLSSLRSQGAQHDLTLITISWAQLLAGTGNVHSH